MKVYDYEQRRGAHAMAHTYASLVLTEVLDTARFIHFRAVACTRGSPRRESDTSK